MSLLGLGVLVLPAVPEVDADGGPSERHAEAAEEVRHRLRVDRRRLGAAGDGREHGRRRSAAAARWRVGRWPPGGFSQMHQRGAPLRDLQALLGGASSGGGQNEVMNPSRQGDAAARGGQIDPLAVEHQLEAGLRAANGQGSRAGARRRATPRTPPRSPRRPPRPQPPRSPARPRPRRSPPGSARWSAVPAICRSTCARRVGEMRSPPSRR